MLKGHYILLPTHSQVTFRLAPGGAEQLVAYDKENACYTPLLLPRQLATGHAAVVLPPALALRALSLRPHGACLNAPLPAGSGSKLGTGIDSPELATAASVQQRAGSLSAAAVPGQPAGGAGPPAAPAVGALHAENADVHEECGVLLPVSGGREIYEEAFAPCLMAPGDGQLGNHGATCPASMAGQQDTAGMHGVEGEAGALPKSVGPPAAGVSAGAAAHALTAAELWEGYQASKVLSSFTSCSLTAQQSRVSHCCPKGSGHAVLPWCDLGCGRLFQKTLHPNQSRKLLDPKGRTCDV